MAKKKKSVAHRANGIKFVFPGAAVLILFLVFGAGFIVGLNKQGGDPRYASASRGERAKAEQQSRDMLEKSHTTDCAEGEDSRSPADRQATFDKYLKVNRFANRAVVRGCNDIDELFFKDVDGKWQPSTVNVSLDLRANPFWRSECLAEDLLEADDTVRAENSGIDTYNFLECQRIKEREFAQFILTESLKEFNETPTEKDIEEYLQTYKESR